MDIICSRTRLPLLANQVANVSNVTNHLQCRVCLTNHSKFLATKLSIALESCPVNSARTYVVNLGMATGLSSMCSNDKNKQQKMLNAHLLDILHSPEIYDYYLECNQPPGQQIVETSRCLARYPIPDCT